MSHELRQRVLAYLARHQVMTVATRTEQDLWAASVFYVNEGFDLYFLSAGHTRHAQHIARHAGVAATIQEDHQEWQDIQGIQLEGEAHLLQGEARALALARYQQKFAFVKTAPALIQTALARVNWYRLTPTRLFFVDNSRGFGHRDEVPL